MDLAAFLGAKLAQSNYRDVEATTGVSRGALEAIIKRQTKRLPEIHTLGKISRAYNVPLWEVMRMAGVDLELPKNETEVSHRLASLVMRVPELAHVVQKLERRYHTDPDHVLGIILGLEASLGSNDES